MPASAMNETLKTLPCLLLALALAACSGGNGEPPLKGAAIGGPFTLTDQDGHPPTDRAVVGQALRRLERNDPARAARVTSIFVSVDPERDTPAVLKEYVAAFH